jgi:hypothetical protein
MERATVPFSFTEEAVTRRAGRIVHNSETLADKTIEQSTFSYVGSANECDNWFRHDSFHEGF